jgi:hypothetical protein
MNLYYYHSIINQHVGWEKGRERDYTCPTLFIDFS